MRRSEGNVKTLSTSGVSVQDKQPVCVRPVLCMGCVSVDSAAVLAVGERAGWRAVRCTRGHNFFDVIELWVENRTMLEMLTAEMRAQYLAFATPEKFRAFAATAGK
jgi:hypothetical protein